LNPKKSSTLSVVYALALAAAPAPAPAQVNALSPEVVPVTVKNFPRAESHMYFAKTVRDGAFGRLQHDRAPVAIDK